MRLTKPKGAWVAITDRYESLGLGASVETTRGRVARWRDKWPRIADDAPQDAAAPRRRRTLARLETGAVAGYDMPTPSRVRRWFDLAPTIGDDLFLKLYTHGAIEKNMEPLLNGALGNLFGWLAEEAERRNIEIHWATAWQMYKAADALIHE